MRNISNDAKKTAVALLMKYAVNFLSDLLFSILRKSIRATYTFISVDKYLEIST